MKKRLLEERVHPARNALFIIIASIADYLYSGQLLI